MAGSSPSGNEMSGTLGALLVDDEPPALRRMRRLIDEIDGCDVLGLCSESNQVVPACRELEPDVVFLDVEMPGLGGLELARTLGQLDRPPAVVFVTAFERYAVQAFDLEAVDFLVKPVRRERLVRALARVRAERSGEGRPEPALGVRLGDRLTMVPLADVRVLVAEDKYISVHHAGGVHLLEDSLVNLEQRFPHRFVRVHRNALVSRMHLRGLFRDAAGHDCVEVADVGCTPEVSRRNLAQVRRQLKQIGKE
ncbi:MAG: DNA-binding response regulator [Wenzhouxiangella sp.]|nr:MAG: DNA-binding response regulator [Wenzhouxiangella sp.]